LFLRCFGVDYGATTHKGIFMRTQIIAGNWKLNKTIEQARQFIQELAPLVQDAKNVEVLVCPVFTALYATSQAAASTRVGVGAQNLYWKESGAYTGEVSAPLLVDAGAQYVVIGHSERRGRFGVPEADLDEQSIRVFGDSDASVARKVQAALAGGLVPIVCVGETLAERQAGDTDNVVSAQTAAIAAAVQGNASLDKVVLAYEPVWAIGTGETCAADEADRVCGVVRAAFANVLGQEVGDAVRIQYGGSVKPDNAADLLGRPNIDGALVGGASLKADSFAAIVNAARGA
jgi:triosephosphate isomerase